MQEARTIIPSLLRLLTVPSSPSAYISIRWGSIYFSRSPFVPMASTGIEPHDYACIVCLDYDPPPIQSGCACRSDTGLAHVGCLIEKAVAQQPHRGNAVWRECQTCGQLFTGATRTGLADAWWSRV